MVLSSASVLKSDYFVCLLGAATKYKKHATFWGMEARTTQNK